MGFFICQSLEMLEQPGLAAELGLVWAGGWARDLQRSLPSQATLRFQSFSHPSQLFFLPIVFVLLKFSFISQGLLCAAPSFLWGSRQSLLRIHESCTAHFTSCTKLQAPPDLFPSLFDSVASLSKCVNSGTAPKSL